ncbi:phosphoenolpyruvate--protein phosphotransferase [Diaminobutyricibacter tongyongensis]|uniref:Phosphoenolpyruvate-protein phosphotransferase n=2 Tax=Leifsonia tongyongensis TaxID=1268043 RepID=A0A6L9Y0I7_9MICO|nr:phosphoenolpyruvate--protein phosphotransferase [Diaminobutyricibacter tongyongensis]
MMEVTGIGVGRGIAVGPVLRMPEPLPEPADIASENEPLVELERASAALNETTEDLNVLGARAGGDAKDVLEAQALMAQDPAVLEDIEERIGSGKTAERAVFEAFRAYQYVLESMGGYLAGRGADLKDVAQRVVAHLQRVPLPGVPVSDTPFVLVAGDLAPADTALLDLDKVLALVTRDGGPTSHTAILARAKGIVAVVGAIGADDLTDGMTVIVDASTGNIVVNPSAAAIAQVEERRSAHAASAPLTPGALADGTPVSLLANLGSPGEAQAAVALGAEGVGLFRTEFLFLDAAQAPSVEEQRVQYLALLDAFPGKKVTVRVLDAGADKPLAFLGETHEENPALGRRGIRALRDAEPVLRDQLQALAEASAQSEADLWVMAPMVADAGETEYFVSLAREFGLKTVGITAEVPAAAILADQIAERTDFVSIGTNDLTQYTMAADRLLGSVASYQDPWHPAVLRMIKSIGQAGRALGKPVGVCGESAADPLLAVVLVGLGATDLSMTAAALADVRAELLRHTLAEAQDLAARAVAATSAADARAVVSAAISGS